MRLVVSLALLFQAAAPLAQAAAVRPDTPKPAPVSERPKIVKKAPKPRKNKAFLAALPQLAAPRWTAPVRLTRLIPEIGADNELDAYFDVFLNEEAEDLP